MVFLCPPTTNWSFLPRIGSMESHRECASHHGCECTTSELESETGETSGDLSDPGLCQLIRIG